MVVVLDFGGQYKQLIARRVRECNVYCEIHPYNIGLDKLKEMNPKGIILTGGPNSVYGDQAVLCEKELYELGIDKFRSICRTLMVSVQLSSVAQSCPTLCDPMNSSTPGLPFYHQLPESTQTHVH